jgi:tRNA threonylcarbamoyladenosine biosynthesis protein TsaE
MADFEFTSRSEADTDRLGKSIAEVTLPGDVVALVGTLGAGKTRLVEGIAVALDNPADSITSPTFVLVNEYTAGKLPVYHFDAYRLKDDDEFLELGAEEYFDSNGLTLVEWGDRVQHLLPERTSTVTLEIIQNDARRVTFRGPLGQRLSAQTRV